MKPKNKYDKLSNQEINIEIAIRSDDWSKWNSSDYAEDLELKYEKDFDKYGVTFHIHPSYQSRKYSED